jgi:hypothetical protein
MDPLLNDLSNQVFGPTSRATDGNVRSEAEGIVEKLTIYYWPSNVNNDQKLATLSYLTAHGRSVSESPSAWATWMYSYAVLCFPEFRQRISSAGAREYQFTPLPYDLIANITLLTEHAAEYDVRNEQYDATLGMMVSPKGLPLIEKTLSNFPPDLSACATVPAVYGYFGLLVFLAGKQINDKNLSAITEKRPQNLIDKFAIQEVSTYALKGDGKMSDVAHRYVNQAWVTHTPARRAIIEEVAAFVSATTLPQRVVYTISKMVENSGMGPAPFIHKFLQARPEIAQYSCIRPALQAYMMSLREVAAAPSHLQPYYKLIHGDTTRAFHRSSIFILSACAVAYERLTSSSMSNFNLGVGASAATTMFDAEAASKGHSTLTSLIATVHGEITVE